MSKCTGTQTTSNFLKDFPTPLSALLAFLEGEKTAAIMRKRQCDKFIGTSKILLLSVDEKVRNYLYQVRKKATEELSLILPLLSLIRCVFNSI